MKSPKSEEEKMNKDIRNLFRLKKGVKGIKDIVLRNIKNLFEYEKEEKIYYKPVRVNNFWNNNYIEYKSYGDKNTILSIEEYLDKIRPYLRDIKNDLKQSDTYKIQLTIAINFISCKNDNDEKCVIHSKSDNIEIMISDKADEVIKKLFDSLKDRYQNNLQSMRGSEFVVDYVMLLYYKERSYRDSPDWIKSKKAIINPINEKDNKCFQYVITVGLNYEEIGKHAERIKKIKPFINKQNWEGINYPSEKYD